MSEPLVHIELERPDERTIVAFVRGEIDLSNAEEVERALHEASREARHLVVDLTGVEYLDSQGVRVLQHLADRHHGGGIQLTLVAHRNSVAGDVLAITRLADTVPVQEPDPGEG